MTRRTPLLVLTFVAALLFSPSVAAGAAPDPFGSLDMGSLGTRASHGCSVDSYEGQSRFGPRVLSTKPPTGQQLVGYQRFGSLDSTAFVAKYWDFKTQWWSYPQGEGYVLGPDGQPIKRKTVLAVGRRVDRYGGESGNFLAPVGTAYAARSLPPSNLSGPPGREQYCDYHVYAVTKQLPVDTGGIAPWFEQPGGGRQFEVVRSYLATAEPQHPQCSTFINDNGTLSVAWLRCAGYLQRVFPALR